MIDHVHIFMDEDGIVIEYCVPASEAQYYIDESEADGYTLIGRSICPGPECSMRSNSLDIKFVVLDDIDDTGWKLVLPLTA